MRQWHVNPRILCRKHLLGEHYEHHKMVSSIERKHSFAGYIHNNCIAPRTISDRHDVVAAEMVRRKYNHKSPLKEYDISYMPVEHLDYVVDSASSLIDLMERCPECRKRRDDPQNAE